MRIHSAERLYKFEECGYACNQSSDLKKHMRIHKEQRLYKCEGGTTSNLLNHINNKHPSSASSNDVGDSKKQSSMSSFLSTPKKVSVSESERIACAIADMIVKDYVPLSIVEGEGFRNLMQIVAPDYKVPCRNTVRSRIVLKYESEKEVLSSELASVQSASITTDTWTSNSTESYITVTEHHINSDWDIKSNVLLTRAMPERHTGENLANRLTDCVSEFGLGGKIDTCVHDNARNMECAGDKCDEWGDLGCFGHTLQLCVKPALELASVSKTIARCRKLVGHFKHSTTLTAEMKKRQQVLGEKEHVLMQDVPTRWNSTQLMLERLHEQRRVVTDIMLDGKFTKKNDARLLLKDYEWEVVSELSECLSVLTDATAYMCSESDVTCSVIYPMVCGLFNTCLAVEDTDSSLISRI
ncbi:E3 SUMO-protein ligase ZBED1-like [Dreissena polymorpha]|uniref:E3 SUMO-protein ligase ZBED1-like n=1 Tax=Dreissena polymorpha TaxID=45954 RepID=UPI0022653759|nr:E3 SUMO-protein ligase ZBED1-like [Dreissena polymorpha]